MRVYIDGTVYPNAEAAARAVCGNFRWNKLAQLLRKLPPGTLVRDHFITLGDDNAETTTG